jgi:NADH-quinone oxidoreductase subunit N
LKYFIVGSFSSGMYLLGCSLIYLTFGSVNFNDISLILESGSFVNISFIFGIGLVLCSLFFKIGAAPFHLWVPDIYQGSPVSVALFFAVVSKAPIFGIILLLLYDNFYMVFENIQPILIFVSFCSLFFGCFGALLQNNLKRLLAYSSISHIGYMLIAFCTGNFFAIDAFIF